MIQFYAPDIETDPILPEGESAHCSRVLRMREGEEIVVTDGKGHRFYCTIDISHPSQTKVRINRKEAIPNPRNYRLTLAVAPTKNSDRLEWLVEKAVEIGVDRIVLLRCRRSERKVQKTERLQKIIVSAMKQSLEARITELTELTDFKEFISEVSQETQKFFGYCSENFPRREFVDECKAGGEVCVMIGPEGDFSEEEVKMAVEKGFIPVSFGKKRLRTETAGVFAICAVNTINQLFSNKK